jgi:hypothetical protein
VHLCETSGADPSLISAHEPFKQGENKDGFSAVSSLVSSFAMRQAAGMGYIDVNTSAFNGSALSRRQREREKHQIVDFSWKPSRRNREPPYTTRNKEQMSSNRSNLVGLRHCERLTEGNDVATRRRSLML